MLTLTVVGLLVVGLYQPTSRGGIVLGLTAFAPQALTLAASGLIVLLTQRVNIAGCVAALTIFASLLLATAVTPLREYAYGAAIPYAAIAAVLCVNLRALAAPKALRRVFFLVNLVNLGLASVVMYEVFTRTATLRLIFVEWYAFFYPELVYFMLFETGKPVIMFASHSIAGFFFYLFFYLSIKTYKSGGEWVYLAFAVAYMVLMQQLRSVTGVLALALAGGTLVATLIARRRTCVGKLVFSSAVLLALLLAAALYWEQIGAAWNAALDILTSPMNGLVGRFSEAGSLRTNLTYILTVGFYRPVGFSYTERLFFGDSGPIEYLLRGSLALLVAMYLGLYSFLRVNLLERRTAFWLFVIIVLFEVGFTYLTYFRFIMVLPFVVAYLNSLAPNPLSRRRSGRDTKGQTVAHDRADGRQ